MEPDAEIADGVTAEAADGAGGPDPVAVPEGAGGPDQVAVPEGAGGPDAPGLVAGSRADPAAQLELLVGLAVLLVLGRLTPPGIASWLVSLSAGAAVLAAGAVIRPGPSSPPAERGRRSRGMVLMVLAARFRPRETLESALLPAVVAVAASLALRLVPVGWELVLAVGIVLALVDRALSVDLRRARTDGAVGERFELLATSLASAFLAFAGAASAVTGSPVSGQPATGTQGADAGALIVLAVIDGGFAWMLGFGLARPGAASLQDAALVATGYGSVVAVGAWLMGGLAVPGLVGPALLVLLLYLWDSVRATTPSLRHDPRWRWQMGLLVVLAVLVVAWSLARRG